MLYGRRPPPQPTQPGQPTPYPRRDQFAQGMPTQSAYMGVKSFQDPYGYKPPVQPRTPPQGMDPSGASRMFQQPQPMQQDMGQPEPVPGSGRMRARGMFNSPFSGPRRF
jgi:hypothetical protein